MDADKKRQLLCYLTFGTEQIWKALPEYKNPTNTYNDFKDAILEYYPDATDDCTYSLHNMDTLIGKQQHLDINSTQDLTAYHIQLLAITSWLIEKKWLGDLEQQWAYVHAFQSQLLSAINNHLQLKKLDHRPSIPYKVKDMYKAACFILQSSSFGKQNLYTPSTPTVSQPVAAPEPSIKKEDLTLFFT